MAYLVDDTSLDWAALAERVRLIVGLADDDTSQDTTLQAYLLAARRAGDVFIDDDWTDENGADETIPDDVIQGVLEWIRIKYERDHRASDLTTKRTDLLEEQYSVTSRATPISQLPEVRDFWQPFKSNILL